MPRGWQGSDDEIGPESVRPPADGPGGLSVGPPSGASPPPGPLLAEGQAPPSAGARPPEDDPLSTVIETHDAPRRGASEDDPLRTLVEAHDAARRKAPEGDPYQTRLERPSSANRIPTEVDPHLTDIQVPGSGSKSGKGTGMGTGTGTGGSSVERGVVEVHPGQVVFGKYLVIEQLGRGGMGEVWLVKDVELDVKRALKMITQGTVSNPEARARFRREARAMARFTHPNVVAVHDSRLDRRDTAYIVMEYVAGQSLEKVLQAGRPMPIDWTLQVLDQLCDALQEAHDQGIIHRDLKPSNLILVSTASGRELLKVLDFGIAKILGAEEAAPEVQTRVGDFMGSPPYASPEQVAGHAEPLSDIYSVGVILYEFLTGRRPFRGKAAVLIANTMLTAPPTFAEVNPEADVPPEVERVVLRCLAKEPKDRPQSPMALLEEFKAALPKVQAQVQVQVDPPRRSSYKPSRRVLWIGGPVVAASLVAGVAGSLLTGREKLIVPTIPATRPDPSTPPKPVVLAARVRPDGREFHLWNGRVYLPGGYAPLDPTDLVEGGYPRELVRADGVKFVRMPAGKFTMGALGDEDADETNRPTREVVVPAYYIQRFEVSNREVLAHVGKHGDKFTNPADPQTWRTWFEETRDALDPDQAARHPVRQVCWKLAADFARRHNGRLPTEAQWEYAARSGDTGRALVWDVDKNRNHPVRDLANLFRDPNNDVWTFEGGKHPGDQTRQGVSDMAGNVREWCRDPWIAYDAMSPGGVDPLPDEPAGDPPVVVRGGSFNRDLASRFITRRGTPLRLLDLTPTDVGFRLVIECPEPKPGG